jgi:DNA-binding MarR family transcriptional regulator
MPDRDSSDAIQIMDALRRIVQALRASSVQCQRELGLSSAQMFILRALRDRPGSSVNDLAAATHTHQTSASEVIAKLEAKGLVERRHSRQDRRRMELSLSPAGTRLVAAQLRTPQEDLVSAIALLPDEKRAALAEGLIALVTAAGLDATASTLFFERPDQP